VGWSRIATSRLHPEQLLLDDIGRLADPSLVDISVLEHGCLDGLIAIACGEVARGILETQEQGALGRQQVSGAAGGLKLGHRR
jgi:hypothetical protein